MTPARLHRTHTHLVPMTIDTDHITLPVHTLFDRLSRSVRFAGPMVVLLWLGVWVTAPLNQAGAVLGTQDPVCAEDVVDTSGEVDIGLVSAAAALVDEQVTVVVRSYGTVPDGDLVATVDELLAACYAGPDGEMENDVVVLAVSVQDRVSDVLIGGRWRPAVPNPENLRVNVMGSRFATDDFTGGLVAALEELAVAVDEQLAAEAEGATVGPDGALVEPEVAGTPVEPGQDGGGLGLVIGGAAAALVGAGGGGYFLVNRRRRLEAARLELEETMVGPLDRQATLRARDAAVVARAQRWASITSGRAAEEVEGASTNLTSARNETDRTRLVLSRAIPDGPDQATFDQVEQGSAAVVGLSKALDQHDDALDRLESLGAHLDHLRVAVPAKVQLLEEELVDAVRLADLRSSEGWTVQPQLMSLEAIAKALEQVQFDGLRLDLLSLSDAVEALEAALFKTSHYLQSLPSRLGSIKQWTDGLDNAADMEQRRVASQRLDLAELATVHAADSWRWAAELPEQALSHIARSDEIQEQVITQLVPKQEFDQAGHELDEAGLELIAADKLLDQVDDLIVDLEQARQEVPQMLSDSRAVLASLTEYVDQHQRALDASTVAAPANLAAIIAGVEEELRQPQPNYLRAAETVDGANRQIDEVLQSAEEQKARRDGLERDLEREKARAHRTIQRTRRALGWELFPSGDARALADLEQDLARLPEDLEQAIESAANVADDALRLQERIVARRRRQSTWVSSSGSSGSGWSSGRSTRSGGGRSLSRSMSRSGGGRSFSSGRSSGRF